MKQIDILREQLHKLLETGNTTEILRTSQELDKLIVNYTLHILNKNKISA